MIWNRVRMLGTLAVFLLVNSCGGHEQNPFEKSFSIQSGDACSELKQVVAISLSNHLTLSMDDLPEVYQRAVARTIQSVANISPTVPKLEIFKNQSQAILKSIEGREAEDLSSCQALQKLDALISDVETKRLHNEWGDADNKWTSFIKSRTPQILYRTFLGNFAKSLDPFSHYDQGNRREGWNFGVQTDLDTALIYGRKASEFSFLKVDGVDRFRAGAFNSGIALGDKIIALKLPKESLKLFGASIVKKFNPDSWIPVTAFLEDSITTAGKIESLFTAGPDEKIQVKVLRDGKIIILELIGIENKRYVDADTIVSSRWLNGTGYIRLFVFSEGASAQVSKALDALKLQAQRELGTTKFPLIFDLRFNPGGYMDEALRIASQFLPQQKIGTREFKKDTQSTALNSVAVYSRPVGEIFEGSLVILLNHISASAAELLPLFLRDAGRAVLVGDDTFGKGIGQTVINFGLFSTLGGTLAFTTDIIFGLSGETPQWKKLQPDVLVRDLKIAKMEEECKTDKERKCGIFSMQAIYEKLNDLPPIKDFTIAAENSNITKPFTEAQLAEWKKMDGDLPDEEDRQLAAALRIAKDLDTP